MDYKTFYRNNGIRDKNAMTNPKIVVEGDIFFPFNSNFHWHNVNGALNINRKHNLFKRNKMTIALTEEFSAGGIGNIKRTSNKINNLRKQYAKADKSAIYLPVKRQVKRIKNKNMLLCNHTTLSYLYKPNLISPLNTYEKWYNVYNTVKSSFNNRLGGTGRSQFVLVDIAFQIPSFLEMKKYVNDGITRNNISSVTDHKLFTLLDLIKSFYPEHRENTIYNRFKSDSTMVLVFKYYQKYIFLDREVLEEVRASLDNTERMTILFLNMLNRMSALGTEDEAKAVDKEKPEEISEHKESFSKLLEKVTNDDNAGMEEDDNKEVEIVEEVHNNETDFNVADMSNTDAIVNMIQSSAMNGNIPKGTEANMLRTIKEQGKKKSPFRGDKRTIEEMLTFTDADMKNKEYKLDNLTNVFDTEMLNVGLERSKADYIERLYDKDIMAVIYHIQTVGLIIESHEIKRETSVMEDVSVHTLVIKPVNGKQSTIRLRVPVLNSEGVFRSSANEYVMDKQRNDKPIRKIEHNIVALTSY